LFTISITCNIAPGELALDKFPPVGFSALIGVYFFFYPLKGRGLFATLIQNVSFGSRFLPAVDFPLPDSAIINTLCAIKLCSF